jgi:hypothetical protein
MEGNLREMKADMKTQIDYLTSRIDYNQEKLDANLKEIIAEMRTWQKVMKARREAIGLEASPEEIKSKSAYQEVPKEEAAVKTIRALED